MERIIVVGNGMVGHHFIDQLIQQDKLGQVQVTTFSEESRLAYDRVQLSSYFSGKTADDLMMTSPEYYDEHGVQYFVNDKVIEVLPEEKIVVTASGRRESYDKLVLATGSYPFVPPIPRPEDKAAEENILVYRTIEDLEAMTKSGENSKVGVVVGGGLLGLEAAKALKDLGMETHVVEFAPRLMAVQVCDGGGAILRTKIEELGVKVHTEKNTKEIVAGENTRYRMNFADGSSLDTDMILFSAGIRPQDQLARETGLELGPRGGIVINNQCQTSNPDIYAIGECALWEGKIFGLVAPGYSMAKVTVDHIAGEQAKEFAGADMSTKLKLMGVDVASIGDAHANTEGALSYSLSDEARQVYKKVVTNAAGDRLLGAVLVGDADDYGNWLQLFLNDMPLPVAPEYLLVPSSEEGAAAAMGVDSLPDSAQICSCFDVTKGQICQAVRDGATTMGDIKATTGAATGCGGCSALAVQVMNAELENLGVEVSNDICEHFAHSRAELADIVRVKKIKTFEQLLSEHGKGHGCEICKPAVGSILATFWNDYVLKDDHISLQDTNDIFLGNMQKDGTYSVVPRIAGGEITPDKLIVLGEVAKEYDLYTKITGGQRVDLFGAQLHELPKIWSKLIDAGFETGHAYGKSLRTVKSCVGSTWCRYGVQDSVGMAILLENRYKGLRAPHKIKFGVSGCTRECAEAQSKDIGIIATEGGWGLYVCGNGGMRPRHADLFATDLDDVTLMRYIDRVLMFYVRTADRLQRTSVWLENLEGGVDYLKEVVIEDKLNICEELEQNMHHVVESYQCEWKSTVNDEKKLARFSQFINADEPDNNLQYVRERGQRRPATEEERIQTIEIVEAP
ncbi:MULTISPECIES: nitrite reductase large subunit NirB [unclassified Agarivorans]|uniref:nitrite reductase large subunit NirB n=1 Tax=unclassified Agarivorans TaxID=2636026 RepID=UPI0026E3205B|nr:MULTISPECIES: nitrite reductase large subunit NirB [unclassified Agarivorans]MDO6687489.1 nitrite reductase large subunit NirB [Agarivorans sp. 3_MG-2023]MDO6715255.1 nitrite reductase large subunit NirB [Agarivorans sp. 2_MG-2023]MDO6763448.1 nitrite reductase large subunit NirB [Agarivorans sp. 1_MG-2023]